MQEWVTATSIRISLTRMNTFGDEVFGDARVLKSYFFAISDLSVGARYFTTRWKQFIAPSHPISFPSVKKKKKNQKTCTSLSLSLFLWLFALCKAIWEYKQQWVWIRGSCVNHINIPFKIQVVTHSWNVKGWMTPFVGCNEWKVREVKAE